MRLAAVVDVHDVPIGIESALADAHVDFISGEITVVGNKTAFIDCDHSTDRY